MNEDSSEGFSNVTPIVFCADANYGIWLPIVL